MTKDLFVEQPVQDSSPPYKIETRPATYKDKQWWNRFCSLFWVYLIFIVAAIAGCVLLPLGIKFKDQIKYMNSSVDFTLISEKCTIEEVTWIKEIQKTGDKGRHEGCDDIWELVFDASSLPDEANFYDGRDEYTFKGIDLRIPRECKSCGRCNREDPRYYVGMESDCWRPTIPDVTTKEGELNKWYRCGNEDCIKILPPQDDVERAKGISGAVFIAGIVCLAVGITVSLGLFIADKKCIPKPTVTEMVYNDLNLVAATQSTTKPPTLNPSTASSNNYTASMVTSSSPNPATFTSTDPFNSHNTTMGTTSDTVGPATTGTSGGANSIFDQLNKKG